MQGWLKRHGSAEEMIRYLLKRLLADGVVDGLLVPLRTLDGRNVVPTLVRDAALLERAAPLAPVLPVNAGTVLGRITGKSQMASSPAGVRSDEAEDPGAEAAAGFFLRAKPGAERLGFATATGALGRVGAVMRNCELRAAVELSKVKQVNLDGVLFIGVDCLGAYRVEDYARMASEGLDPVAHALAVAREGRVEPLDGFAFRPACAMCERPIPGLGDSFTPHIALGLLGVEDAERLWVSVQDEALAGILDLESAEEPEARVAAVQALVAARTAERDRRLAEFAERAHDPLALLAEFSTCIRCQNCMVTCPICYCKECIFRTEVFDHPSSRYWDWAERKGGVRLPSDTLLFHVTRMLHMAHACVGCGMCSDGCPVGIPVADIFRAVGQRVQESFAYVPGRDPDEEMIIATFREDELGEMGK